MLRIRTLAVNDANFRQTKYVRVTVRLELIEVANQISLTKI